MPHPHGTDMCLLYYSLHNDIIARQCADCKGQPAPYQEYNLGKNGKMVVEAW